MPCYHPIPLYRSTEGINPKTGKAPLVSYSGGKGALVRVSCGRCIGCRLENSRQWACRIMAEFQTTIADGKSCIFLTLTYRNEELVYGGQLHGILVPRHLELFWKRLRKYFSGESIRYYACGEYGDKSNRPHYHACVFGIDFSDKRFFTSQNGNNLYTSVTLDRLWTHGHCIIGNVDFESAAYVARYCLKKRMGNTKDTYECDGITPEFARMSRRPPIGREWFKRFNGDVFPHDVFLARNFPSKPPRFFMRELEKHDINLYHKVIEERAKAAELNYEEGTGKRLKVRERVKLSSIKPLTRRLD